jgi:hypothetical protein
MSDLEVVNFRGFGNATTDSASASTYFEVHQRQWMIHPAIALALGSRADVSLGPVIQHSTTDNARISYLSATRPYGFGTFDQVGMQFGARYEWRDVRSDEEHTHHRVVATLQGRYFPPVMDVRSGFEDMAITIGTSFTVPIPTHPLVVVRAGGRKLYGDFPFYEAATLGGPGSMRYMDTQRYAGDASLYGTSEIRLPLAHFQLVIPVRMGVVGLAEAGRVYTNTASPGGWHSRTGEGIWFGRGNASPVLTFIRTTEPGHTRLRIALGLNF